ncbi:SDR family NAD(P)-dependent oxidoreductase [Hyphomicrobium sp. MC1]|uniref:SDR family NAD(P)-dependent oxidoreductase n=1 Tax=Hyphomicrobium sp. (strain MC1) TaxID=717785 RepID=UPI000213EFA0|nr:SDR family NAD(P)-dependent oxidoreductase [Hyphomicrobium sp. MC1]CCB65472.1 3-beta hydroxysteroid dehydrogenase/isomerase family [Hyphomicrobium sp. MC1]
MVKFAFEGKTVLITGASQGIGLAIAEAFAQSQADVAILAENDLIYDAGVGLEKRYKRPVRALKCDISDQEQVRTSLAGIERFDVVINNAGYQPATPISVSGEKVDSEFRRVIDVNVMGTYYVTREALPRIPRGGRIIMTASIWGRTGAAGYSGYAASKHAIIGFMRSLAMELGRDGITVNAVCPGWVDTEGAMWTVRDEAAATGVPVQALVADYLRGQPIAGVMPTTAIAPTYLFLASESAADITGQCIGVDRGSFIG